MSLLKKILIGVVILLVLAGVAVWWLTRPAVAELPLQDVTGTEPVLAEPDPQTIPTVAVARPIGWADGAAPEAAEGLQVNRFARRAQSS